MAEDEKTKVHRAQNGEEIVPRLDSAPRVVETWAKQSPEQQSIEALKQSPAIDLNSQKYKDTGKVHHGDLDAAIERTIAKREAAQGVKFDAEAPAKPEVNLNGIVDERPKQFWKPPRIGNR